MREKQTDERQALPGDGPLPVRLPTLPKRRRHPFARLSISLLFFAAAFCLGIFLQANGNIPSAFTERLTQSTHAPSEPAENPPADAPEEQAEPEPKTEPTEESAVADPLPQGQVAVARSDLAGSGEVLQNLSIYAVDPDALTLPAPDKPVGNDPLVLILCTHSSECYSDGSSVSEPIGDAIYSSDPEAGVLAVAKKLAESLSGAGIPALFCNVRHDEPTLRGSYARAKESIKTLLGRYPGIRYVIDLHRDGILSAEGDIVGCAVEPDGASYAQILPVVGSDGDGSEAYPWKGNLALALELEARLNERCPRICRPVSLRNSPYNQNIAPHSLLIEVGAAGNTIEEAKRSAELLSQVLAAYLKGN